MSREATQFKAGSEKAVESGRIGGRASGEAKREKKARREVILGLFRSEPLSPEDDQLFSQLLLNATNDELREIATNNELPTYMRRRARLLVGQDDDKAVDMAERILDRAFGKPTQKQEVDAKFKDMQPVVVADFGIKK